MSDVMRAWWPEHKERTELETGVWSGRKGSPGMPVLLCQIQATRRQNVDAYKRARWATANAASRASHPSRGGEKLGVMLHVDRRS